MRLLTAGAAVALDSFSAVVRWRSTFGKNLKCGIFSSVCLGVYS